MAKRTSNSSVNSSIRQNTASTEEGMSQLLVVQKESLGELSSIRDLLQLSRDVDTKQKEQSEGGEQDTEEIKDALSKFTEDLAKTISSIKTIPTAKEQVEGDAKGKFGSISNTLDTLGLAKKGAGTMLSNWAEKADDRKQFVKDQKTLGSEKSDKELKADYAQSQSVAKNVKGNEGEIARLKAAGMGDTHEHMQGLLGKRQELTTSYSALDKRIGSPTSGKPVIETSKNESSVKPVIETSKVDTEATMEASRAADEQTDVLKQIAQNTAVAGNAAKAAKPAAEKSNEGGGLLDSIMGMFGEGFMKSIKAIFNPKTILKALGKVFVIGTIIGALFSGITDAFDEFMQTGDIGKALIAGLAGIIDFLTFGLFDKEKIKAVIGDMAAWVNDRVIKPVFDFFTSLKDGFMNLLKKIKIPAITIPFPKVLGGDITIGPFDPFGSGGGATPAAAGGGDAAVDREKGNAIWKEEQEAMAGGLKNLGKDTGAATPIPAGNSDAGAGRGSSQYAATDPRRVDLKSAQAPEATSATQVSTQSAENAGAAMQPAAAGNSTVVSAPTINNVSKQTNIIKSPVRNQESTLSSYVNSRYVF